MRTNVENHLHSNFAYYFEDNACGAYVQTLDIILLIMHVALSLKL